MHNDFRGKVIGEFKRIGGLVWRGLFATLNCYFFITRLSDIVIPNNRVAWAEFAAIRNVPQWQVSSSQALTVLLTGILLYCTLDQRRYEIMHDRIEFIGVHAAAFNLTHWMYAYKDRFEQGVPVERVAQKMTTQFGVSLFMLVFCILLALGIEIIFGEKKVEQAR